MIRAPLPIFLASCFAAGCHCPQWPDARDNRFDRISRKTDWVQRREASRPDRIARLDTHIEKSQERHEDHLERTADKVADEIDADVERWYSQHPRRRDFFHRLRTGRPETYCRTWSRMVY